MSYAATVVAGPETASPARTTAIPADSPLGRALRQSRGASGAPGGFNSYVAGGFNSFVSGGFNSYVSGGFNSYIAQS